MRGSERSFLGRRSLTYGQWSVSAGAVGGETASKDDTALQRAVQMAKRAKRWLRKLRFYFFLFDLVGGGKILNGECVQHLEVLGLYITHG